MNLTFLKAAIRSSNVVVIIGTATVLGFSTSIVIMEIAITIMGSGQSWCRSSTLIHNEEFKGFNSGGA